MLKTRTYFIVFLALLALTGLTFGLSLARLGALEVPVALTIALAKGLLVLLFFMHLVESERPYWLFLFLGVLLMVSLVALMTADVLTREPGVRQSRQ
jgi:cytochrome c oxidase subunit 4